MIIPDFFIWTSMAEHMQKSGIIIQVWAQPYLSIWRNQG
jgi:hypothetical protein